MFLALFLVFEIFYYPSTWSQCVRMVVLILALIFIFSFAIRHNVNIIKLFYKIFFLMSLVSLFIYIIVEILHINLPYTIFTKDWLWVYKNYGYVYYARDSGLLDTIGGVSFTRNNGFFSEPGMYCVFLDLCVFINLFCLKEKKKSDIYILLFTIGTTSSTMGILALLFMFAYYVVIFTKHKSKATVFALAGIITAAVIVISIEILSAKVINHTHSVTSRQFDLVQGMQLFLQKPFFGWGFKNIDVFFASQLGVFTGLRPNSNGVVSTLYQLGVVWSLIYFIPYHNAYKLIKKHEKKTADVFRMFGMLILILTMGQPIQYTATGYAIIAYLFAFSLNPGRSNIQIQYMTNSGETKDEQTESCRQTKFIKFSLSE